MEEVNGHRSIFPGNEVGNAPADGTHHERRRCPQPFPARVITIVVPTAPATPPDIISRVIANELSESEGWRIIVENKAGAVLTLGGTEVLKRPADGYAIYAMALPVSAAPVRPAEYAFSARKRLRTRNQSFDLIQRSGRESRGTGEVGF
jgi:hypothetical protein